MSQNILILNGSPVRDGNTVKLVEWFSEGVCSQGGNVEIICAARLAFKASGCTSCRMCQKRKQYECVIDDDVKEVLRKMVQAETIVFATPLYFYGPSAQLKLIIDRMFSLYKWDNTTNTFTSPMRGKTMALILSAYEDIGLKIVEKSFKLIADYSGMRFKSLLVPNARESGEVEHIKGIRARILAFAKKVLNR